MYLRKRQSFLALALIACVLFTACPKSSDLDRMAKASNELAHDLLVANRVTAEFYAAGRLPLAQKDKAADLIGRISQRGQAFNDTLIALDQKYPQGTIPPASLAFLRENWSEISGLLSELTGTLLPFGMGDATKNLNKNAKVITEVLNKQ